MRRRSKCISFQFVEFIPNELLEEVVYISVSHATAAHKCCCGCGNEVITPFSPTDWKFTYNGKAVSLSPSIGNWSFMCKSHYWIERNKIVWAEKWSGQRIRSNRACDRIQKTKKASCQDGFPKSTQKGDHSFWSKIKGVIGF